jgi:catechol 2,3-dioxygenase-like lactoylglutathione lyase family enzyme
MIDHVSIAVSDLAGSAAYYETLLATIGLTRLVDREGTVGFGKKYPEFWLNARPGKVPEPSGTGTHICLRARSREAVDAFFAAALAGGGRSDGEPGPRQGAMTTYYGAFILDPEGNKIEAVTFPQD